MHAYTAYGLSIRSTLELPELRSSEPWGDDVDVIVAPMTEVPGLPRKEGVGLLIGHTEDEVLLRWPYFGTYRVQQGRRIEYAPVPGLEQDAVRVPLIGVCSGVLLHQRGLFALHGGSVGIGGTAVAFVGEKGAGKSTTTAALVKRGHALLADDVVAVEGGAPDTEPRVLPGPTAMKLWPDSMQAVGIAPEDAPTLHSEVEKRIWHPRERSAPRPTPLRCIYVLEKGDGISIAPVPVHEAFAELVRHTYAARFLGDAAGGPEHFRQCAEVLRRVPVRRLVRSGDVSELGELVARIEDEWG